MCYVPNSKPVVLEPGSHWLSGLASKATQVQLVDASRRCHKLDPVTGVTLDGWNVTLQVMLVYEVVDPIKVARAADPIAALASIAQAALLAKIETVPHEGLLGTIDTPTDQADNMLDESTGGEGYHPEEEPGQRTGQAAKAEPEPGISEPARRGLGVIEKSLLAHLETRPGLDGLRIVDLAVVSREGDARLLNILQGEALARLQAIQGHKTEVAQAEREKMRLEMQVQTAQASRTVSLIQAETQAQLASIEGQIRLIEAKAEAEVQEIQQAQEAREAERKRIAEEWRTAKELDLRLMEYHHAEALAVIEGTAQITTEAAKNGLFNSLQGNTRRVDIGNDSATDVVGAGIQALRGFREKIAPPTTHFLPRPDNWHLNIEERVRAESLRLERIRPAEHELILRRGEIRGARIWFTQEAPSSLANMRLEITCPEGYPIQAPIVMLHDNNRDGDTDEGTTREYPVDNWDAQLFLADLVQEIMLDLVSRDAKSDNVGQTP